ncbi:DUF1059 domain-containing protein [Halospeciosus flavus]|uniref:DUF1059 domain-containing protein n=1 Tax=Halospeciosus flavus TaxID=3032283 RepID=A0ABD5Z589_9EURY|nr:DUF1059 domain-containing protein [Halospeciosus flavus]
MVKTVACADAGHDCDFVVQTDNVDELVHHYMDHAERQHDREVSRSDAEDLVTEVPT